MRYIKVIARGNVQQVGYRAHAKLRAHQYGVSGYAKNLADGTVELEAAGNFEAIDKWLSKIERYPNRKTRIEVVEADEKKSFSGFKIL